ncbi:S41 family peptidase, partial [Patescibacteria group bacterium]|nr:S41 family peptidase [Patescibacteria group bacterium]
RQVVKIASVRLEIADDIAVLRINKFGSDTEQLFKKAVAKILSEGAKGIVLDMRNNPGGFLDVGVKIANEFLPGGMIVEERFRDGKATPFSADGSGKLKDLPVVVLVDGGSASAAEIVAGAIRDNQRGQLIGETTYGKGSVQEVEEFSDGSALRITVAHWFTPLGTSISEGGLKPDIVVKSGKEGDAQLDKAISELKKLTT